MKYKAGSRRRAREYEKAILEWWKKNRIFEKSIEQRSADEAYVFYDGPPFITGMPHHGTLLSSIIKDVVPRYWTMRGKRVERRWGWDCHGLPAENFVEKQLGITDRRQIGAIPEGASEEERAEILKREPGAITLESYIVKARESMVANSETWRGTIDRIGRWVDFDTPYRTMDKDYMESVWWAFKTLFEKGKIFEGRKVLMYDTKFGTPVSKAEVTMDNDAYQTVTDPSAYVLFALSDVITANTLLSEARSSRPSSRGSAANTRQQPPYPPTEGCSPEQLPHSPTEGCSPEQPDDNLYLLAWTTTPWTLPANKALAVSAEIEYGVFTLADGKRVILSTKLAKKVLGEDAKAEQVFSGKELEGLEYVDLMDGALAEMRGEGKEKARRRKVFIADFVGEDEGTGVVHIAPAYGEDDYKLYLEHKGEIKFEDVVDGNGYYLPEIADKLKELGVRETDENGIEIWAGNKFIAKVLAERGVVLKIEYIKHEYPFNPRSKQRIMYRAFPSWFFDISGSKAEMLEKNENINWFPGHFKLGRFRKNIEAAPDWNLSRDRFWATPMPVWKGNRGTVKVVGSFEELFELSGVRLEDYHRPWIDAVEFDVDGEHFKRVDKVLDCWFESGSMPFAQMHYPFENKEKFEKNYPADFVVEYVGQIRAWFYYLHAVNTALFAEEAFKNVIVTGTLAGNDGRKMSKSLGNYTDPNVLMDKFSADSLRFLLLSSPVVAGEDFALLDKDVSDVARKLSGIWNVFDFFTTYAEVDKFDPDALNVKGCSSRKLDGLKNVLDRWIVSRVHEVRDEIVEGMEEYNLSKAVAGVLPLVDDLSNWFVRRSRRRFWKSEDDGDKREAYETLYYVLVYFSEMVAPFVPFLAEELYQKMTGEEGSVHLLDFPKKGEVDEGVIKTMARAREAISEGLNRRMRKTDGEEQVKVRQPLAKFIYKGEKLPAEYEEMIRDELNVKEAVAGEEYNLDKTLTQELKEEGLSREVIRLVQSARKKAGLLVDNRIKLRVSGVEIPERLVELVKNETLAVELNQTENYEYDEIAKIDEKEVMISLEKA